MIEIPESILLANQISSRIKNKTIVKIAANESPHRFVWYEGDPAEYGVKFSNRVITGTRSFGGKVQINMSGDAKLVFDDGVVFRYFNNGDKAPSKRQLFIELDDGSSLIASVRMYGGVRGYVGSYYNEYDEVAKIKPSPLSEDFTLEYFDSLRSSLETKKKSVKEFLATEQRIPGLGNGVFRTYYLMQKFLQNAIFGR